MDNLPGVIILICAGGVIFTALATSMLLYRYMIEPKRKRDLTINSNIWPLTLPAICFNQKGQKIRTAALLITLVLVAVAVITLVYVGAILWLG